MPAEVTSIVLAGGKNLRLGRNKAFEIIKEKSIIDRIFERLESISDHIIVVTSWSQFDIPINNKAEVAADIYPDKGPLGGIYTGLITSTTKVNIIVACDMPFLNTELLQYMIEILEGCDVVVPRLENGMIEPLHAVYSKSCLSRIDERLAANKLSIHGFLDDVSVRYLEEEECRKIDPCLTSFFNINYQTDLDKAYKIAEEYDI